MRYLPLLGLLLILGCTSVDECNSGDACTDFECQVTNCWCAHEGVLYESGVMVVSNVTAASVVSDYLGVSVDRAVSISDDFYNVFVEDEAYTVYKDGTIIMTQCGV
ncbi:MAG: hypothetical protein WC307_02310 [Candidatus Nanoarchaeia archaeon]|jgi:hypothetical protein